MNKSILYIGNALSGDKATPTTIHELGKLLSKKFSVAIKSDRKNKIIRLLDMCFSIWRMRKNIDVVLIDVYSTTAFYFAVTAASLCNRYNIPYVLIAHGGNLPERIKKSPAIARKLFDRASRCITPSDFLKVQLEDLGIRCEVIRNPIDIKLYEMNFRDSGAQLLWVRSLHSIYNPSMALEVLKALVLTKDDAALTMVGPEKDIRIDELEGLAINLRIREKVTFTGLLDKNDWIKLAGKHTFFINTTNVDNAPVSVIEAMALGLIVISTKVGGTPYLIKDKENGFLVDKNDHMQMSGIIQDCIKGKYDLTSIRNKARAFALSFDQKEVLHKWTKLLEEV